MDFSRKFYYNLGMIISAVFSKPVKTSEFIKIRIMRTASSVQSAKAEYYAEFFTQKQVFHKTLSEAEAQTLYNENAGKTFKNVILRTESEEITTLVNRHGEAKKLVKKTAGTESQKLHSVSSMQKKKNYILSEGKAVPFLVELGVMTKEGKVVSSRYDKFRQINRYLEFVDDILDELSQKCTGNTGFTKERPLYILDFGSGKSYLTFAVYYFLSELKHIPVKITGIDLKEDVIKNCASLAQKCGYSGMNFYCGDVSDFDGKKVDLMMTLHACDTATDYALNYAVKNNAAAILSVPCCQHEINLQLKKKNSDFINESTLAPVFKHGLLQERFAAIVTDAARAELLEANGYRVNVLEFIDDEGTPKNVLLRAVKKNSSSSLKNSESENKAAALLSELGVTQKLLTLLK